MTQQSRALLDRFRNGRERPNKQCSGLRSSPMRNLRALSSSRLQVCKASAAPGHLVFIAKKKNMKTFIVLILFCFSVCGVQAETGASAATSPAKIVSDLYSAHRGKADPLQYPASKNLLGAYFDAGLLSLFLNDQSESQGEVGKVDFDPLYAAQDFEIKDFSVRLIAQQKHSAEVAAFFKNIGTREKIGFLLSNTGQGWRITDIKYSDGRTLKGILK
jgi:hypothetical protein